jgi:hypothetical protein
VNSITILEEEMSHQSGSDEGNQAGQPMDNRDYRHPHKEGRHEGRFNDPMRSLFWGLLLILLGALFFATTQNWLSWDNWWRLFLVGLGVIFIIDALVRYLIPGARFGIFGRVIAGIILIVVGSAFYYRMETWWPLILVVIGVALLVRYIVYRR